MTTCPCDQQDFPARLHIPSGLSRLPRQIGLFGDFQADLLSAIRSKPALAEWQARSDQDLGLLLLDWWAVVSDVVSFYSGEHAQAAYLASADEDALRKLVALIGYKPRPAIAAEAYLAALVDGPDAVDAPAGTGVLSDAVGNAPPQEFETVADVVLDPRRNSFQLQMPPDPTYRAERLILDPASRALAEDSLFAMDVDGEVTGLRVARLVPERLLDGTTATRLHPDRPEDVPTANTTVDKVTIWAFAQLAPVSEVDGSTVTLAGLWPQLRMNELVLVEDTGQDGAAAPDIRTVTNIETRTIVIEGAGSVGTPVTDVTLSAATTISAMRARLHFGRVRGGRLLPVPRTSLLANALSGLALAGPVEAPDPPASGLLLAKGAGRDGVEIEGEVQIDAGTGAGDLLPVGSWTAPDVSLRAPVNVHANVLHVTRGKTVEEVLGDGTGTAFQTFRLAKTPLTYVHDQSAPGGRRSTLKVYVDGLLWREVDSLFFAGPEDRVYTVALDESGQATITMGGEGNGLAPPVGVRNIFAVYRYGAGDPLPPAMGIQQLNGPVANLRRVFNPTPAFGGAAASRPEDMRFTAPESVATFDRAVSARDFAALARDWGALSATAVTEWVPERLREGVVVTAIFDGGGTANQVSELAGYLTAHAAEALPVRVVAAIPRTGALCVTWQSDGSVPPDDTAQMLRAAFLEPYTGVLSPQRAEIGGPMFRSTLLGTVANVPGVGEILSLTLDGLAMPVRLALPPHNWFSPEFSEVRP